MEQDLHLRSVLTDVGVQWGHDELYEAFVSLVYNTNDDDLKSIFETELMEIGYLDSIEDDEI